MRNNSASLVFYSALHASGCASILKLHYAAGGALVAAHLAKREPDLLPSEVAATSRRPRAVSAQLLLQGYETQARTNT